MMHCGRHAAADARAGSCICTRLGGKKGGAGRPLNRRLDCCGVRRSSHATHPRSPKPALLAGGGGRCCAARAMWSRLRMGYSARHGPRPAGRYASPSMVTLRAGRYINVPAFVAVRLTLRRLSKRPAFAVGEGELLRAEKERGLVAPRTRVHRAMDQRRRWVPRLGSGARAGGLSSASAVPRSSSLGGSRTM